MNIIDSVDEELVRLLGRDGRQNSETLAKQLNISSATVRRRLRKLIHSDLLRIIGVVDSNKFSFPVAVVITLDVDHDKLESAINQLADKPEIRLVSSTTGRFDIIAFARFQSNESLSLFMTKELTQIEGIRNSETFICLHVKKGLYTAFP